MADSRTSLVTLVLLGLACGRTQLDADPIELSIAPPAATVHVGERQQLRALTSTSDSVRFEWLLRTRPLHSAARLTPLGDAALVELQPDVAGLYSVEVAAISGTSKAGVATAVVIALSPDAGAVGLDAGNASDGGSDGGGAMEPLDAGRADGGTDAGRALDAGAVDAGHLNGSDAGAPSDAGRDAGSVASLDASVPATDGGLDPNEVYILGTFSEGSCARRALSHWSTPDISSAGFDCYFDGRSAAIRPSDRRLLYIIPFEWRLREFHDDGPASLTMYPTNVLANDRIIPTPPCSTVDRFLVAPDSVVLHQCPTDLNPLRDESGTIIFSGVTEPVLAVGPDRVLLTTTRVIDTRAGVSRTLTWPVRWAQDVLTVRWQPPSSFLVVLSPASPTLWEVQTNGSVSQRGVFSPLPAQVVNPGVPSLDGSGRLFQQARDSTLQFTDVIVRREVGGTTSVVYSEATGPAVRLHASDLVTGP